MASHGLACKDRPEFGDLSSRAQQLIVTVRDLARQDGEWPNRIFLEHNLGTDAGTFSDALSEAGGDFIGLHGGGRIGITLKAVVSASDSGAEVVCLQHFLETLRDPNVMQRGAVLVEDLARCPAGPLSHRFLLFVLCSGEMALTGTQPSLPIFVGAEWPWWPAVLAGLNPREFVAATSPVQHVLLNIDPGRLLHGLKDVQLGVEGGTIDRRRCAWLAHELGTYAPSSMNSRIRAAFEWVGRANAEPTLDREVLGELASWLEASVSRLPSGQLSRPARPIRIEVGKFDLKIEGESGSPRTVELQAAGFGRGEPNLDWVVLGVLAAKSFVDRDSSKSASHDALKQRISRINRHLEQLGVGLTRPIRFSQKAQAYVVDRAQLELRLAAELEGSRREADDENDD